LRALLGVVTRAAALAYQIRGSSSTTSRDVPNCSTQSQTTPRGGAEVEQRDAVDAVVDLAIDGNA
jgi:hypothetical protein